MREEHGKLAKSCPAIMPCHAMEGTWAVKQLQQSGVKLAAYRRADALVVGILPDNAELPWRRSRAEDLAADLFVEKPPCKISFILRSAKHFRDNRVTNAVTESNEYAYNKTFTKPTLRRTTWSKHAEPHLHG